MVEDDVLTLMASAESLRDAGLFVIEAETAEQALDILKEKHRSIGVVFSDIETPGNLDGIALAQTVAAAWPSIPVVLTSGRIQGPPEACPGVAEFIGKPYNLRHVCELIARLAHSNDRRPRGLENRRRN